MLLEVEQTRLLVSKATNPEKKSQLGQFFTPANIAQYMASLFICEPETDCRLLDAGAGVGSLSAAFRQRKRSGALLQVLLSQKYSAITSL